MDPGQASFLWSENEQSRGLLLLGFCAHEGQLGGEVLSFKASTGAGVQERRKLGLNDKAALFGYGPNSTRIYWDPCWVIGMFLGNATHTVTNTEKALDPVEEVCFTKNKQTNKQTALQ